LSLEDSSLIPDPTARKIRIFAFDPGTAAEFDTIGIGEITIPVLWEKNLLPGPVGEYIEVIDADPASGVLYKPVDLNDPRILAEDGLAPSETNPMFHQQMVYAVAMSTISYFEQALGRVALWSRHYQGSSQTSSQIPSKSSSDTREFVRRLRIYPHALRERNAYYSPNKKALLFGYFPTGIKDKFNTPGTMVYTCLSHDIIAHETTHALLDGVHPRFNEPTNPDVFAFHEAFADLVALFQRFSYPGVLRDQINKTRGNLAGEHMLSQLAQQFGRASGRGQALREFLGQRDENGVWTAIKPDVRALETVHEPHDRGAILVAAVFGAFLKVYRLRTADLYRIASEGTGVLRAGDIHPDLANRLADEAARCASYILQMCIRGLDYCPPVGITFGDYLRAVVTADYDLNPDDPNGYRLAFVESFRQWGIFPLGMKSMSVAALLWPTWAEAVDRAKTERTPEGSLKVTQDVLDKLTPEEVKKALEQLFHYQVGVADNDATYVQDYYVQDYYARKKLPTKEEVRKIKDEVEATDKIQGLFQSWNLESDRFKTWQGIGTNAKVVWHWLVSGRGPGRALAPILGIDFIDDTTQPTVYRGRDGDVATEVHSVRTSIRRGARGGTVTDLVIEITQRRRGYFNPEDQEDMDTGPTMGPSVESTETKEKDFIYRAGCTLIINPVTSELRRVIRTTGTVTDNAQLERMRSYLADGGLEPSNAMSGTRNMLDSLEPFALLHQHGEA
jgi:hypothetical protein